MNTIILITNQEEIKKTLQDNTVLLRETDKFVFVNYEDAVDAVLDLCPDIVLIHECEQQNKTLNIIRSLKSLDIAKNLNIILVANRHDRKFILSAYDDGVDDYFCADADPLDILIRILSSIKKSSLKRKIKRLTDNLEYYGVVEAPYGFYNNKYEEDIVNLRKNINS